ncbi:Gag protein [Phytophthora palmivora]|uniref:Gag protein n=1 Tax=Phytophthora palmivora TaxID=4796 RepID=A0A2P4X8R9_9STRA|nr:Gag protein [Phytophthora palmivora]
MEGRSRTWAYTREATTPGCFTTWAQLCQQLRAAFLPATMRIASARASLPVNKGSGTPYLNTSRVTVFMDGLKVGPSRTQLFRVHANTMEEAIQIALQGARILTSVWQGYNASTGAVQGAPATGASTGPVPMELGTVGQSSIRCYGYGKLGHMQRAGLREGKESSLPNVRAREASGRSHDARARGTRSPVGAEYPAGENLSPHGRSAGGAHHGGLVKMRKSSSGLLVVHASVRGFGDLFLILIDSGASTNFARRQTVARNGDKYADALRESKGRGQVSVRLADGTVVSEPGVRMDLVVKFEDLDSTESFLVLDTLNSQ